MALAELGQYAQAVQMQRNIMAAAEQAGFTGTRERLEKNLKLYERGAPCRTPFTEAEMPSSDFHRIESSCRSLPT